MDMTTNSSSASAEGRVASVNPSGSRRALRLLTPYLLIAPTLILVLVFTVLPSINTVGDSLYSPARIRTDPSEFVGLENYADLFDSSHYLGSRFLQILGNTLLFTFGSLAFVLPLALLFALLLNRSIRLLGFWRFSFFYPALLPMIGAASIWAFLFSNDVGLVNTILTTFGIPTSNWIGDPNLVLLTVTTVNIWKQTGYYMLFYLAALQNIPREIYEAAGLDGAGPVQQLFWLTLPLLRRTTLFILIVSLTFSFQTVEQLSALGQGLPADRGNLLLWFVYQNIGERRSWGYVNAMTVILVLILLAFTLSNLFFFEGRGKEDER